MPTQPSLGFAVRRQIHESLPEYIFELCTIAETWQDIGNYVTDIKIRDENGVVLQVFEGIHTEFAPGENARVFEPGDWNFDGYLDIRVWEHRGGSMRNDPHLYWLWDAGVGEYVPDDTLSEMSWGMSLTFNDDEKTIISFFKDGWMGLYKGLYIYNGDELIKIKSDAMESNHIYGEDENITGIRTEYTTEEFINGEWVVTGQTREEVLYD